MDYVTLGHSDLSVSRVGLGAIPFGSHMDDRAATTVIDAYIEAGGNLIDTANIYGGGLRGQSPSLAGSSERALGRLLKSRRQRIILATKGFSWMDEVTRPDRVGLSRAYLQRELDASLQRLNTDYIDLYQCHAWDFYTPLDETLETLNEFVSEGKIRAIGVSNWDGWQVVAGASRSADRGRTPIASNQIWYNLADRGAENAIIPACQSRHVSVIAWGVLAQGFLSGRYTRGDQPETNSRYDLMKSGESSEWSRLAVEQNWNTLDLIRAIAKAHGRSIPSVATRWLLQSGNCDVALIGGSTVEQYKSNLAAVPLKLTDDEVAELRMSSEPQWTYPANMQRIFGRRESPYYGNIR